MQPELLAQFGLQRLRLSNSPLQRHAARIRMENEMPRQLTSEIADRVHARVSKQMQTMPIAVSKTVVSGMIEDIIEDEIERSHQRLAEDFFRGVDEDHPIYVEKLS